VYNVTHMADGSKPPPEDLRLIERVGFLFAEMERLEIVCILKSSGGYIVESQSQRLRAVVSEHEAFIVEAGKKARAKKN
jgi:hypothetical protein